MGLIHISDEEYQHLAFAWGLHYDAANKVIYGERKGYPFLLYISQDSAPLMFTILISAVSAQCPQIGKAEKKLLKDREPMIRMVTQRDSKITILCANLLRFDDAKKVVDSILSTLVSFMKEKGFVPCCENCKHPEPTHVLLTGYEYRHLCSNCEAQIAAQSRKDLTSEKAVRKNGIMAILCAIFGAAMGIVFMALVYPHAGGILTLIMAGLIMGACTVHLGLCIGDRPSTAVKIAVVVILVLAVFVGYNIGYVMVIASSAKCSVGAAAGIYYTRMIHGGVNMDVWIEFLAITYIGAAVSGIIAYRKAAKKFGNAYKVTYIGRDNVQASDENGTSHGQQTQ